MFHVHPFPIFPFDILIIFLRSEFKTLDHWSSLIEPWKPNSWPRTANVVGSIYMGLSKIAALQRTFWVNPLCLGVSSMVIWCHLGVPLGHTSISLCDGPLVVMTPETHWDPCIWCVAAFPRLLWRKKTCTISRLAHHYQHIPKCLW